MAGSTFFEYTFMKTKHTEASILEALRGKFTVQDVSFRIENAYVFKSDWESDFLIVTKAGYAVEFEIKISRADFLADKRKVKKHSILEKGTFSRSWGEFSHHDYATKTDVYKQLSEDIEHKKRPHRFYYVVPSGMLASSEVPKYAGLMCVYENGQIEKVKEAPFIHKEPLNLMGTLATKFYYYFERQRSEYLILHDKKERLVDIVKRNGHQLPWDIEG
jgi:hypothetical protein